MTGKGKGKGSKGKGAGAVVQAGAEAGAVVQARPRGGRRPGAGRRPAGEAPRIHPLTVKVSEAELGAVKRLASEAGLTPSAWLWGLVRAALDAQPQPLHAAPSEPNPSEGVPF